jgi:hypothetical protein
MLLCAACATSLPAARNNSMRSRTGRLAAAFAAASEFDDRPVSDAQCKRRDQMRIGRRRSG